MRTPSVAGLPRDGLTAPCRDGDHEACTRGKVGAEPLPARASDGYWCPCGCGCHYHGSAS